jgi:hypothetical protein
MNIHQFKNLPLFVIRKFLTTFFSFFSIPIGNPKKRELHIIKEVKDLLNKKLTSTSQIGATNYYLDRIRKMLLGGDIRKFIRYDVVLNSLFVQNRLYLIKEYKFVIKNIKNYKNIYEDKIGFPIPFFLNFKTSGNRIHHLYHILRFKFFLKKKKIKDFDIIFDWGGGYGSMCRLFYKLGFKGTYIIFDFDELHFLQYYYLKTLGHKINLGNTIKLNHINLINDENVIKKFIKKNQKKNNLFLSCWALSETEKKLRKRFEYVFKSFDYILLGFQEKYFGINNIKYFKNKINIKNKKNILIEKNSNNFENHYYIFSKRS